jgi:hypothetical protein
MPEFVLNDTAAECDTYEGDDTCPYNKLIANHDMAVYLRAYVECMFFVPGSSDEDEDERIRELGTAAMSKELCEDIVADCMSFYASCQPAIHKAYSVSYTIGSVGHDFWLTRNRHGAGFWDRGLGPLGKHLSDAAKTYGERSLYVGDDGLIYSQ